MDNIVALPRLRIIVTLRADFYACAIAEATLAKLQRRDRGTFPLDHPGMSALHEMIIRPAEAAGVELQKGLAQRLLVTGKGEDDQPTLEVAHETVLNGWERLRQWIREHAQSLRARRDLERVAAEWDKSNRHASALRSGKLLQRYLSAAEPHSATADDYLVACKRHRMRIRTGLAVLGLLAMATLGILFHVNHSDYPPTLAAKALFVQLGIWPVPRPEMVPITAGEFEMGKYEVIFDEYDLFAAATGHDKPADQGWGRGDRPVIYVSWDDAVAYAQWLSARTGLNYRLPSEAEWEYAIRAQAPTSSSYYWEAVTEDSAQTICDYANLQDRSLDESNYYGQTTKEALKTQGLWAPVKCSDGYVNTAPVRSFLANAFGLHNMSGNVWEWVQDCSPLKVLKSHDLRPANNLAVDTCGVFGSLIRFGAGFLGPRGCFWNLESFTLLASI